MRFRGIRGCIGSRPFEDKLCVWGPETELLSVKMGKREVCRVLVMLENDSKDYWQWMRIGMAL